MSLPVSKTQIDKLGDRLRKHDPPAAADLELLQSVVGAHQTAEDAVVGTLRELGYQPTARLKTWPTIVDKLRRESV